MVRNYTDEDLEKLAEILHKKAEHNCPLEGMDPERKAILFDVADGGRMFKKMVIYIVVLGTAVYLFSEGVVKKLAILAGITK